jgi:hypothetical protein
MALFRLLETFREARSSPRHDVDFLGQIDLGGGAGPLDCIISDISASGAKLTIGARDLPDEFTLLFRRRCRLVRSADGQIGVEFVRGR